MTWQTLLSILLVWSLSSNELTLNSLKLKMFSIDKITSASQFGRQNFNCTNFNQSFWHWKPLRPTTIRTHPNTWYHIMTDKSIIKSCTSDNDTPLYMCFTHQMKTSTLSHVYFCGKKQESRIYYPGISEPTQKYLAGNQRGCNVQDHIHDLSVAHLLIFFFISLLFP